MDINRYEIRPDPERVDAGTILIAMSAVDNEEIRPQAVALIIIKWVYDLEKDEWVDDPSVAMEYIATLIDVHGGEHVQKEFDRKMNEYIEQHKRKTSGRSLKQDRDEL